MLRNYLLIAFRNLLRDKIFSFINIVGLAVGITACLFIIQYVRYEKSYDENTSHVYRLAMHRYVNGDFKYKSAKTYPAIAPRLKQDFAEITNFVRLMPDQGIVSLEGSTQRYYEDKIFLADESFFNIFPFRLSAGNNEDVLRKPNSIVLSKSSASKYFGARNPVGGTLNFYKDDGTQESFQVTGVSEDTPGNSHLQFDMLISYSTLIQRHASTNPAWRPSEDSWEVDNYYSYVVVDDQADHVALEQKLPGFFTRYKGEIFKARNVREELYLQPVRDIHLYSDLQSEIGQPGNYRFVYYLQLIAAFIMIIAWINYVNLTTAKMTERLREVGVRKVFGSQRNQLIGQFILESVLTNIIALTLAFAFYETLLPVVQSLIGIGLDSSLMNTFFAALLILALSIVGMLLSSFYPALVLSGFKPIIALKGKVGSQVSGINLRKSLVLFQFIVAILMITGLIVMRQQMRFMKSQDLGFDKDRLVVIKAASYMKDATEQVYEQRSIAFKNQLLTHASIENATESGFVAGLEIAWKQGMVRRVNSNPGTTNAYHVFAVDEHFFDTYSIELLSGKLFDVNFRPDDAVVINEAAALQLGFEKSEDAIGEEIFVEIDGHDKARIAGVVKNYHHLSLKNNFQPQLFFYRSATWSYFTLKIKGKDLPAEIELIKEEFSNAFPDNPFDYFFMDEFFDAQYKADQQFERIFGSFSVLAIGIACLGLFGLSSYTLVQRTKEIGIHKVLGASTMHVINLLSRDLVRIVGIATIVTFPLAYALSKNWLNNYAFHMEISWWLLLLPGVIAMALAVVTVSMQTLRVARANPAKSLRYE